MSRLRMMGSSLRTVTAVDTNAAIPVAIVDGGNTPAGVCSIAGAAFVILDLTSVGTTLGSFALQLLIWNGRLGQWVSNGADIAVNGQDTLPTPRTVAPRMYIANILGDWAFPFVKTFATGTTSATVSLIAASQA